MKLRLKNTFVLCIARDYPLTNEEDIELKRFLDKNLAKGYIVPSTSEMASAFSSSKRKMES